MQDDSELSVRGPPNAEAAAASRKRARSADEPELVVVLDLDHTLLHASSALPSTEELTWARRNGEGGRAGDGDVFRVNIAPTQPATYWVKIRPGVPELLRELRERGLTLVFYTNAVQEYAKRLISCLDRDGTLAGEHVIWRESREGSELKSLALLAVRFGLDPARAVVVDDRLDVWSDGAEQIVRIKPFFWFTHGTPRVGQLAGGKGLELPPSAEEAQRFDDRETRYVDQLKQRLLDLAQALQVRRRDREAGRPLAPAYPDGDVAAALSGLRNGVFSGLAFCFSGVFAWEQGADGGAHQQHPLWRECERFGARCALTADRATHLILGFPRQTSKYNRMRARLRAGDAVHIVSLAWVIESLNTWSRLDEALFPVIVVPAQKPELELGGTNAMSRRALVDGQGQDKENLRSVQPKRQQQYAPVRQQVGAYHQAPPVASQQLQLQLQPQHQQPQRQLQPQQHQLHQLHWQPHQDQLQLQLPPQLLQPLQPQLQSQLPPQLLQLQLQSQLPPQQLQLQLHPQPQQLQSQVVVPTLVRQHNQQLQQQQLGLDIPADGEHQDQLQLQLPPQPQLLPQQLQLHPIPQQLQSQVVLQTLVRQQNQQLQQQQLGLDIPADGEHQDQLQLQLPPQPRLLPQQLQLHPLPQQLQSQVVLQTLLRQHNQQLQQQQLGLDIPADGEQQLDMLAEGEDKLKLNLLAFDDLQRELERPAIVEAQAVEFFSSWQEQPPPSGSPHELSQDRAQSTSRVVDDLVAAHEPSQQQPSQ
jgi:FMN phosphatase YigB (HAD superfamily)